MQGVPPKYTGVLQGLRLIHAEDGLKGFFRGNLSNVIRITPASAFQFFFYDLYKKVFFGERRDLHPVERLGAGGLAGMTACLLTYPLDFVRARLTLQGAYKGIFHTMSTVVRESGYRGLFKGLWPSLVGVFPYIGIGQQNSHVVRSNVLDVSELIVSCFCAGRFRRV
jgi:solute carrier family 25 phosphate transporter 23/24/25/41